MRLPIYKKENGKRTIEKVYETDEAFIGFGVVDDILGKIDIENSGDMTDKELIKLIISSKKDINKILKDIFEGLTDSEIKNTNIFDLVALIKDLIKYAVNLIYGLSDEKN